ncbi:protein rep [Ligilactobacillus sp. WILCCON 0076]|uniref:Protein rep n=1 Tax=Ligilactobacillus ubinensis TaxID=2876789 RepID=A0A9X2JPJ1_9LACO|nr:protein rep [Ligilactobacillus ubinensis]MCP0887911.1 protein rep [Ligilactobacillus ubinensis]
MYNKKILRTKEYTEVWEYSKLILTKGELVEKEVHEEKELTKRKDFDELTKEEQKIRLASMKKKRREAKWRLQRIIDSNFDNRTSFLTLTTKENIKEREKFIALFKAFVKRFNYAVFNTKKSKLKYCGCLEKQKRGSYHIHLLMFDVPYVPHKQLLELWGLGAVRINHLDNLDDSANAGRYVSKYLEKGIGDSLLETFSKDSYLRSRNLKIPVEEKLTSFKPFNIDEKLVVYETDYVSKIYVGGKFEENPVHYRKIKNREEN